MIAACLAPCGVKGPDQTIEPRREWNRHSPMTLTANHVKHANSSVNSEDRGYQYDAARNLNYRTNSGVLGTFTVDGKNQLINAPNPDSTAI